MGAQFRPTQSQGTPFVGVQYVGVQYVAATNCDPSADVRIQKPVKLARPVTSVQPVQPIIWPVQPLQPDAQVEIKPRAIGLCIRRRMA